MTQLPHLSGVNRTFPLPGESMVALFAFLSRHDERILHAVILRRRGIVDAVMRQVTHLGDAWFVVSLCLGLAMGVVPGWRDVGVTASLALVGSHLVVQLLKRTVHRPRPCLPIGCAFLVDPPDRFSFPSGHAAAAMSMALPVAAALPPAGGVLLLTLAVLVGVSRCYLGVHYPGDVVTGWLLAGLAVLAAPGALL